MYDSKAQSISDAYKNKKNKKKGNRMDPPRDLQLKSEEETPEENAAENNNIDAAIDEIFTSLHSQLPDLDIEKEESSQMEENTEDLEEDEMRSTDMSDIFGTTPVKEAEEPKPSNEKSVPHFRKLAPKKAAEQKAEQKMESSEPDESKFMVIDISGSDYSGVIITNNGKKIKITL